MNDQQKVELTTPSGKEFSLKTFITARERNNIRSIFFEGMKVNVASGENSQDISGKIFEQSETKLIETLVISFDGSEEKILDRLLDCSPEDYDFVTKECDKIAKGSLTPAK